MHIKEYAQYFTTHSLLHEKIAQFIRNEPDVILEPSVGRGDLLSAIHQYYTPKSFDSIHFDCYEIDSSIPFLNFLEDSIIHTFNYSLNYTDFLKENITKKYKTIIGNPPFIRTKNGNTSMFFVKKCIELLEPGGELIFVLPSDFFKLTSSEEAITKLIQHGQITDIFHPNKENLFINASIDVLVMRYCLDNTLPNIVQFNNVQKQVYNSDGVVTFASIQSIEPSTTVFLGELFEVYVGLVSGRESIFKQSFGNIYVLNDEHKVEKYIYIEKYPSNNSEIDSWLFQNKDQLLARRTRKFNEKNWYEWGAPRNINSMKCYQDEECIYVRMQTRKDKIAFRGKVQYFGPQLIMLRLKPDKKKFMEENGLDLESVVDYLNSWDFMVNFSYSGRFRIGQRMLVHSFFPIY